MFGIDQDETAAIWLNTQMDATFFLLRLKKQEVVNARRRGG